MDPQIREEGAHRQVRRAGGRNHAQSFSLADISELPLQLGHSSHIGQGEAGHEQGAGHGQEELEEVRGHDAPQAGEAGVHEDEQAQAGHDPQARIAGKERGDAAEEA